MVNRKYEEATKKRGIPVLPADVHHHTLTLQKMKRDTAKKKRRLSGQAVRRMCDAVGWKDENDKGTPEDSLS